MKNVSLQGDKLVKTPYEESYCENLKAGKVMLPCDDFVEAVGEVGSEVLTANILLA